MKFRSWEVKLAAALITFSIFVYTVKFYLLGDPKNTYMYVFNALGFLPVNVLLVTLVLNKLLSIRAKKEREDKINILAGAFFSEFGTALLHLFVCRDPAAKELQAGANGGERRPKGDLQAVKSAFAAHSFNCPADPAFLGELKTYLKQKKDFLLRLLENPALLESESFTFALMALLHLVDELEARSSLENLPDSDLRHLAQDSQRAYRELSFYWLHYLAYLKKNYPYLFSLAQRLSPFSPSQSPVVLEQADP